MCGFIYIWRDRKQNRYYIGSHVGDPSDGYVCSSSWMLQAYKKRPEDFKRRILEYVSDRERLNSREHHWLQKIKPHEMGKRYYNLRNHRFGHWTTDEQRRMTVGQKISQSRLNMSEESRNSYRGRDGRKYVTEQMREKCRAARAKQIMTPEHREKILQAKLGGSHSEETRLKISLKGKGRKLSEETRRKMSLARKGRPGRSTSAETREKISQSVKKYIEKHAT